MPLDKQVGLLRVAVQEYREGFDGSTVVEEAELAAAAEILRLVAATAPSAELDRVIQLVAARAPTEQVEAAFGVWFEAYGVGVVPPLPPQRPSVASGARLFARYCTSCHGAGGDGKGTLAALVEGPPPANFTDEAFMSGETPNEFFQVLSYGLPGTAMPEWGPVLSVADRWDLVAFLWGLRESAHVAATTDMAGGAACLDCHDGAKAIDLSAPGALLALSDSRLIDALPQDPEHRAVGKGASGAGPSGAQTVAIARKLGMAADALGAEREDRDLQVDPRHVLTALRLVAEEYRDAVRERDVISPVEYGEARLFQARVAADVEALATQGRLSQPDKARELVNALAEAIYSKREPSELTPIVAKLDEQLSRDVVPDGGGSGDDDARTVARVEALVAHAQSRAAADAGSAADTLLDAYMIFEGVERHLAARDAPLASRLERSFALARGELLAGRAAESELASLRTGLMTAHASFKQPTSAWAMFVASLFIILREGFEAILIISALAAYLTKGGHARARRWLYAGAGIGICASFATAGAIELVLGGLGLGQEVLEGATMLLAAVVLFSVSYWLISKVEAQHWQAYIREKLNRALGTGSVFAMAGVSFLAVFREGFETVLFYRALTIGSSNPIPIAAGLALGAAGLVVLYVGIARFSMRIPIKPFFTGTGLLLYVLSFRFLGAGIAELQEAGVLSLTPVSWWPDVSLLDMASNLETGVAQMTLIVAALVAAAVIGLGPRAQRA